MKHEEWIKRKKIEVLDKFGTILQVTVFVLGIIGCMYVSPIFYIPILVACVIYAGIVYNCIKIMMFDIQTDLWNDRFEETMNKMIVVRR